MPLVLCTNRAGLKTGGPLEAKRIICGSHTWSGGPVVMRDQLQHDSTLAGTLNFKIIICCQLFRLAYSPIFYTSKIFPCMAYSINKCVTAHIPYFGGKNVW